MRDGEEHLNVQPKHSPVADSGRGPAPPLGKPNFFKRAPLTEHSCYPPTEPRRLLETTEKFCYHPPPPTESRRLGTSHERGRLFRKILDLRLHSPSLIYAVGWFGINGPFGRHGPCRELVMKNCRSQLDCQCTQLLPS